MSELRPWARQALDIIQSLRQAFPGTPIGLLGFGGFHDVVVPLRAALKSDKPIVHVLIHGRTPCWLAAPPSEWPEGEKWVSIEGLPDVPPELICEWCIKGGPDR